MPTTPPPGDADSSHRIDWTLVTLDHVRQACDQYDAGIAVPTHPAKNTFLILNGKSYPGKFIRGLSYRIATGVQLDPNKQFSGGQETVRFFTNLGLQTSASAARSKLPSSHTSQLSPLVQTVAPSAPRKYEPQKQALYDLLKKRFGVVECEAEFPWLIVPRLYELTEPLASIFHALEGLRGCSNFFRAKDPLQCDFCAPKEQLIVEYDERQHFTLQRAKVLELYPPDISLGFDRKEWITACLSIKAVDSNPPYRDEQRAYYDALRDILAVQNGYRLVRFRGGAFDWTSHGAETRLALAISD